MVDAATRQLIEARHEEVLGQPPRLLPLDRASVADEVQAATRHLRGGVVGDAVTMPLDAIPEIMFTMCRFPDLWQKIMDLSIQIQGPESVLSLRDRKLAILRTGWLCQAPYEFGEHVNQSKRAGFTAEEIDASWPVLRRRDGTHTSGRSCARSKNCTRRRWSAMKPGLSFRSASTSISGSNC